MGIRNKSLLCLLAVLLPLTSVGLFSIHLVNSEAIESAKTSLSNILLLESERIDLTLDEYAKNATALATRGSAHIFFTEIDRYRQARSAPYAEPGANSRLIRGFGSFSIVDPASQRPLQQVALGLQRRASETGTSIVELRLVDRAANVLGESVGFSWNPVDATLAERAMLSNTTSFGDAFVNNSGERRLGIVAPVTAQSGNVVGAILMEALLDPLTQPLSKYHNDEKLFEAHIAQPTMQGDAQFLTPHRKDKNAAFNRVIPADSGMAINLALDSPESQILKASDYNGVESYLAIQTVAQIGWGLVVKVDSKDVYAPIKRLRNRLGWATMASIACVGLIYWFIVGPIVNRLNKAAAGARQIMDGQLSVRVADSRNDEISELAASINLLARNLEIDQRIRSEVEARLRHQAIHDELTGLLNRKHANKVIDNLSADHSQEHAVIFLDLDGFKEINDSYGHAAGDQVLMNIARRLCEKMPPGVTLARWGGDEFVIILPCTGKDKATAFALQLHKVFDYPVVSSEGKHNVSCSVGLATSGKEKTLPEAIAEADSQMYKNKNQRKLSHSANKVAASSSKRTMSKDLIKENIA